MSNAYDKELCAIAKTIREASDDGSWGDYEIGMPITEIQNEFHTDFNLDMDLWIALSRLELNDEELTDQEEETLISGFVYSCNVISELGVSPNQAIWEKFYINENTHAIPISLAMNEINREIGLGGGYQEGLFDIYSKSFRRSSMSLELREKAYRNASKFVKRAGFPIGLENIGIIQLVLRDWLVRTGKAFSPSEMKSLLMGEVMELIETERSRYSNDEIIQKRVYEACDVMIYIMHIFTIYGMNMGEVLNASKESEY
jgi:NTP pyrophosphatase (non-canonical NTP hydrolase)